MSKTGDKNKTDAVPKEFKRIVRRPRDQAVIMDGRGHDVKLS